MAEQYQVEQQPDPCRCGHVAEAHHAEHDDQADTHCTQCGPALCPRYRPAADLGRLMHRPDTTDPTT